MYRTICNNPFYGRCQHRAALNAEAERWMAELGLEAALLSLRCDQLSGGQRQRLSIVRALMTGRTIFVADEPTSALDDRACQQVIDVLLRAKHTVILISHDHRWVERCGRRILVDNQTLTEKTAPHSPLTWIPH